MIFFPYEKCKKVFSEKGLELSFQESNQHSAGVNKDYINILIDGKVYYNHHCKEMLTTKAFAYLYYLKYKKYHGGDGHFLTIYKNNHGEIKHSIKEPKLSLVGAFGIGCCSAIKQMNEIEERLKFSKTKVCFIDKNNAGRNVFDVTLSDFWLTSTVHFTFAISLLKNQFWNKKESMFKALDFIVDNHYEIFDNSFVNNWPFKVKELRYIENSNFTTVGCLTFTKALEEPYRLYSLRKRYKGSFFDVTYNYLKYKKKEKVA